MGKLEAGLISDSMIVLVVSDDLNHCDLMTDVVIKSQFRDLYLFVSYHI